MATITQEAIQLDFREGNRLVTVSPEDQDRFIITVQQAALACQMGHKALQYQKKLFSVFTHVHRWCTGQAEKVETCLASFQDGQWTFFFTTRSQKYDFDLGASLADLDIEIVRNFNNISCDTLQIPAHSPGRVRTFVDPSRTVLIYGERQ